MNMPLLFFLLLSKPGDTGNCELLNFDEIQFFSEYLIERISGIGIDEEARPLFNRQTGVLIENELISHRKEVLTLREDVASNNAEVVRLRQEIAAQLDETLRLHNVIAERNGELATLQQR